MSTLLLAFQSVTGSAYFYAIRPFTITFLLSSQQAWLAYVQEVAPPFIGHPVVMFVLLVLTAAEWGAEMNIDTREIQHAYSQYISPVVAFAATMGYIDAESHAVLEGLASTVPMLVQSSIFDLLGSVVQVGASLLSALVAWVLAGLRVGILNTIAEMDEDDDLGIQSLINWSENMFVLVGFIFFIVLPLISILLFVLTSAALFLVQRYLEHREKQSMIACTTCATRMLPSAVQCYSCGQPNPTPHRVGVLGQPRQTVAAAEDMDIHRFELTARKRCSVCATRLKEKSMQQSCPTCETQTFASIEHVEAYLARLQQRLPRTLLISFGLSFVPLVGLVPGIIYYRISLITSLRAYIPRHIGCFARWGVRLWNLLLISFQWVPVLGSLTLPLMCYSNYMFYRLIIQRETQRTIKPTPLPEMGPEPGAVGG
jgi:hypothetical protein